MSQNPAPPNRLPENVTEIIKAHITLYRENPEAAHMWDAGQIGEADLGVVPTLLLTTIGRKSGEKRYAALAYLEQEGKYLIVGSKGGLDTHPTWYLNLTAQPACKIQVAAFSSRAVARDLDGAARDAAWGKLVERFPSYRRYQTRTTRKIPVIEITPRPQQK
jgi:deazaflavin-dependent oxidoreductase (nitroreductase family)